MHNEEFFLPHLEQYLAYRRSKLGVYQYHHGRLDQPIITIEES